MWCQKKIRAFLVGRVGCKIPIQKVWSDIKLVIAVCRHLVFVRPHNQYAVLPHKATHTAVTDTQADLFQLFRHAWAAIAAKTETGLFCDVCQRHQI